MSLPTSAARVKWEAGGLIPSLPEPGPFSDCALSARRRAEVRTQESAMTITLPLDTLATFAFEHPWPAATLTLLIGVVCPAIWSTHCWRRRAAMEVIRALCDTCTAVAAIFSRHHRGAQDRQAAAGHGDQAGGDTVNHRRPGHGGLPGGWDRPGAEHPGAVRYP